MSDDRFDEDSTVFAKPSQTHTDAQWFTLRDWLRAEFEAGRINTPEVKALVEVFGKQKVRGVYEEWKAGKEK